MDNKKVLTIKDGEGVVKLGWSKKTSSYYLTVISQEPTDTFGSNFKEVESCVSMDEEDFQKFIQIINEAEFWYRNWPITPTTL